MQTVVDRPLIQYEAREAGIDHFGLVSGRNEGVIEDHFCQFELEARGKVKARQELRSAGLRRVGAALS